jgi:hypothetical protein
MPPSLIAPSVCELGFARPPQFTVAMLWRHLRGSAEQGARQARR